MISRLSLLLALVAPLRAQAGYAPSPGNRAARQWFQDAKFGVFIHWGVSSVLQDGEWVMQDHRIAASEYETLAPPFNPVRFDPAAWVSLARAAGARYITLITKHHDGFALWDSNVSDWDVVDRTQYGRDIVRQLADECRRQDMKLFVYYSQLDWHHPDYFPRGRTGEWAGRPDSGQWSRYLEYMNAQLRELFTHYGALGGVWFDGEWDRPDADWRLDDTYAMLHTLQPQALIGSNHHHAPHPGEDFQMFEKDLPGAHTTGFNQGQEVSDLPLETAETINDSWGFRLQDKNFKSTATLIRYLVEAAGRDANFLLNVGPTPLGTIPAAEEDRLRDLGRWLATYGPSVYGTRGGPIPPRPWGVTTRRGDTVFVHVLDWADRELSLPPLGRVRAARLVAGGGAVPFRRSSSGVTLLLPPRAPGEVDQVVRLELAR
jgi:alpha-L-fucosidase